MRNAVIATIVCASFLGGCAQMRQSQREAAAKEKQASCQTRKTEMDSQRTDTLSKYLSGKSINSKFPMNGEVTFEQTQDASKPTTEEARDIFGLRDLVSRLQSDAVGWWIDCAPPTVSNAKFESNRKVLGILDDLSMRRVTYGEAMQRFRSTSQEFENALPARLAEAQQKESEAIAREEQAINERSAAAAARAAAVPSPFYIQPPPPQAPAIQNPTRTNCYKYGSQLNCTTF